jgi:hypothetical protein
MCFPLSLLLAQMNNTTLCCSFNTSFCIHFTLHLVTDALLSISLFPSTQPSRCLAGKSHPCNLKKTLNHTAHLLITGQ